MFKICFSKNRISTAKEKPAKLETT